MLPKEVMNFASFSLWFIAKHLHVLFEEYVSYDVEIAKLFWKLAQIHVLVLLFEAVFRTELNLFLPPVILITK